MLAFDFCRLCDVIRVFSSPLQRPMTPDFEGSSIPDFIHYIYFPILILEKEPVIVHLICFNPQLQKCSVVLLYNRICNNWKATTDVYLCFLFVYNQISQELFCYWLFLIFIFIFSQYCIFGIRFFYFALVHLKTNLSTSTKQKINDTY